MVPALLLLSTPVVSLTYTSGNAIRQGFKQLYQWILVSGSTFKKKY